MSFNPVANPFAGERRKDKKSPLPSSANLASGDSNTTPTIPESTTNPFSRGGGSGPSLDSDQNLPSSSAFRDPLQDDRAIRKHASHRKVFLQEVTTTTTANANSTSSTAAANNDSMGNNNNRNSSSNGDLSSPPLITAFSKGGADYAAPSSPAFVLGFQNNDEKKFPRDPPRRYEADDVDQIPEPVEGGCLRQFFHEMMRHGGIGSSVFNFTAGTVGAGFLALPQAFALCGYVQGTILLLVFGVLTVYSVRLLGIAERRTGLCTFEDLSRHLLGRGWDIFTTFIMISFNWGTCVAYIIALIKLFSPILEASDIPDDQVGQTFAGYWGARLVTIGIWAVFMVPMSLQKELNSLRYASLFSIVAISYFIFVIVGHAIADGKTTVETTSTLDPWLMSNETLVGITLIMFAFCCQSNVYEVFGEMAPRSVQALTKSSGISVSLSGSLYLMSGWFGYLDFGKSVHGAILDDYHPKRNVAILIAFICLCVKLCTSFLLCIHPTRDSILYTLNWGSYLTCDPKKRMLVTFILCVLALVLGLFIPSITIVFGLLGGLGGSTLGFLFPAMYCLFSGGWTPSQVGWVDFLGAWMFMFLACLTCAFGVVASVNSIIIGE